MNPLLRLLFEVGPLLVFFAAFQILDGDMLASTAVFMIAVLLALVVSFVLIRRIPRMTRVVAAVVLVFGALTLWLENATFIKMKPTIIYGLFALAFGVGLVCGQNYMRIAFEDAFSLSEAGWRLLTQRWVGFFVVMAIVNELVWRTQSDATWVGIKTFAYVPAALAFALLQWPLMRRHWSQ